MAETVLSASSVQSYPLQLLAFDWHAFPCRTVPTNNPNGYRQITIDGKVVWAHRAAYEEERGPIPSGLTIDHLCLTKNCIEPFHLEAVTNGENVHRANVARGHVVDPTKPCRRGHAPNWAKPRGQSYRCRTCQREDQRVRRGRA